MSHLAELAVELEDPSQEPEVIGKVCPTSPAADTSPESATVTPPPADGVPKVPTTIHQDPPKPPVSQPVRGRSPRWSLLAGIGTVAAAAAAVALFTQRSAAVSTPPFPTTMPEEIRTHLHQVRSFALEENESVITVTPRVSLDPRGGFLVADSRESQVRRYDDGGRLLSHFGRKGRGPGEFEHVSAALRTHDGGILTVDMGGRAAQFDGEGRTLLSTRQLPVTPVHEAAVVDDSTILVTGRRNVGNGGSLLHLWNRHTGELTRSFFPVPAHRPELAGAYAFAGTSDVAVKGDTAAAVFALSDTLYLFTTRGETIDRIPLPFERFRPVGPLPRSGEDFRAFQEWGESYSSVSQVYFAPGGGFLVEYYDLRGAEPQWRLLHVSRQGERIFESASARLMAVDLETGLLYFADPSSETLDRWVAFRLPA